jgi:hypothetical protein
MMARPWPRIDYLHPPRQLLRSFTRNSIILAVSWHLHLGQMKT